MAWRAPRAVWLMVPAAVVDQVLASLTPLLEPGDIVIDGGNSWYRDDIRRGAIAGAGEAALRGRRHQRRCRRTRSRLLPDDRWRTDHRRSSSSRSSRRSRPGLDAGDPRRGALNGRTAPLGYLHCGPHGAGHFVKMIHNGIEYGVMAAYAEGLNILHNAGIGKRERAADAETAPLGAALFYQYEFDLPQVTEVWRHGSVISSWLLDLTARRCTRMPISKPLPAACRIRARDAGRWPRPSMKACPHR